MPSALTGVDVMISAALVAASLLSGLFQQGDMQTEAGPTQLNDVIVSGQPLDRRVGAFIDQVVEAPDGRGPARWHEGICAGAVNFRNDVAQFMIDRVSETALDIGLEVGEPGCRPNILIIGASDGANFARALVDAKPRVFRPGGSGMTLSRAALNAFQTGDAPVRWWHIAVPTNADTGATAVRLPGYEPPTISITTSSRLRTSIRNDLNRVIVIVDMEKLGTVSHLDFGRLADYIAMVSFSQVDADANTSDYNTILNVLSGRNVPGLTDWDRSYLQALYSAELERASPSQQAREIRGLMVRRQPREDIADPGRD